MIQSDGTITSLAKGEESITQIGHEIFVANHADADRGYHSSWGTGGSGEYGGKGGNGGEGGDYFAADGDDGTDRRDLYGGDGSQGGYGIGGNSYDSAKTFGLAAGEVTLLAANDINIVSKGISDNRVGHLINFDAYGHKTAIAAGDIRVATDVGDINFNAKEGWVSIGHDVPARNYSMYYNPLKLYGDVFGDIITIAGGNVSGHTFTGGNINVTSKYGFVHVGHGHDDHIYRVLWGDIAMVADFNFTIAGNEELRARIGNGGRNGFGMLHKGVILLGWDQYIPGFDTTGRFFMNQFSTIDSGHLTPLREKYNPVILIGTRRGPFNGPPSTTGPGLPVNIIENDATINGVVFDDSLGLGARSSSGWNINTEFQSWEAEKWGYSFFDLVNNSSLANLLSSGDLDLNLPTLGSTYEGPFTFYYLDKYTPPPIFDLRYYHPPYWGGGVGEGGYVPTEIERDEEEITGESNYQAFGG